MRPLLVAALLLSACKKEPVPVPVPVPVPAAAKAPRADAATPALPTVSKDADAAFWLWVKDHRLEIAQIKRADEPVANELASRLHRVDPRLIFELGIASEPKQLIISADGHKEAFPAVLRLVGVAPAIPGWKVVAFRPRKDPGLEIDLGDGIRLSGKDLYFVVLPTSKPPAPMDMILYMPGLTGGPNDDAVRQAAFLLLDAALGEYDTETKIGGLAWKPVAEKPASARPFRELPATVDRWK